MTSPQPFSLTLPDLLQEIAARLTRAHRLVGAALACAKAGAEEEAVGILMDLESDTHEADRLLSVVTLVNRIRREREEGG